MQKIWKPMRQLPHPVRRVYPLLCYLIQNNDQINQLLKISSRRKELEQALNYLDLLNNILFSHILETGWQHD